jgi:catechol 2,3-dioxygenase-like lactoylglutathione lyase family enzyme
MCHAAVALDGETEMGLSDCRLEAAVAVSDLERARRFYEEGLGLRPGEQEEGVSVRYPCGDQTALFIYLAPDNAGRSPATLAGWFVHNLGETMAELGGRGVSFEQYDQPGLATDERGVFEGPGFRAAWVKDPDGNVLALTQQDR